MTHHLPLKQSDGFGMPWDVGSNSLKASGEDYAKFFTCVLLSGPVLVGYTQTLNDWYDRDLDAINEPYRPIPSGRITEERVGWMIWTASHLMKIRKKAPRVATF